MTEKHRFRNDMILIAVLLLVAFFSIVCYNCFRSTGNTVTVRVDGTDYGVYPLSVNATKDIYSGENGCNLNRLVIRDGKAYIETATCPDGICVAHKPIFRDGESIICLPNRVVVTISTADHTDTPDVIM